jgi:hypothetical protein
MDLLGPLRDLFIGLAGILVGGFFTYHLQARYSTRASRRAERLVVAERLYPQLLREIRNARPGNTVDERDLRTLVNLTERSDRAQLAALVRAYQAACAQPQEQDKVGAVSYEEPVRVMRAAEALLPFTEHR